VPRPVEGDRPYNAGLDGIRAIAVLGVIAYHLNIGWAKGGLLGVGVFFVLSGYLITDLLVSEYRRHGGISLGRFWQRRARRLLPALLVMLLVTVAWATLFDRSQLSGLRSDLLPAIFYFSNWWYIFHHVSYFAEYGPPSPLGHLWSLAVEEQFYLVWPLALLAALRWVRDRRLIVAGALLVAAGSALEMALLYSPVSDPTRVYDGTDTRAFALMIGAALAFVWPRDRAFGAISAGARRILEAVGAGSIAIILVFYWRTGQYDPFAYRGGMVLLSVCTALLIAVSVHPGARVSSALGIGPLRWIGERSYGIYLWQLPVIVLTTHPGTRPSGLRDVLEVAAILAISGLSWRFVEQPVRHGALGRLWQRLRQHDWSSLWPDRWGWAGLGGVLTGCILCLLGLSGAVSGGVTTAAPMRSIRPPAHHVDPATTPPPGAGTTTAPPPLGRGVTAIGDSIMVDAAPYLEQMLPGIVIDAQVGQQLDQVDVAQLKANGDIGDRIIIELGTNGYFSTTQLEGLLNALGPMQRVVLVNTRETRPWEQPVNQSISSVAHSYPNTTMVDWYDASAAFPQYFEPDGVHLNSTGAQFYASLIVKALDTPAPPPTPTTTSAPPRGSTVSARHSGRRP
jgi:peptidoglycan/LPS O-acetylase OafA/YrhL